jgi:hypothetical protein
MSKRINKPLAIKRFMEGNPMAAAFVIEALERYAKAQLTSPDWEELTLINQDYWRDLARKALDVINAEL